MFADSTALDQKVDAILQDRGVDETSLALAIARLIDPTVREVDGRPVQRWEVNVLRPYSGSAWLPKHLEPIGSAVEVDVITEYGEDADARDRGAIEDAVEQLGWHRHGPFATVAEFAAEFPNLEPVLPVAPAFAWGVHPIPEIVAPAWADPKPQPTWSGFSDIEDPYPDCPYDSRCANGDLVLWWEHTIGEVPFFFKRRNAAFDVRLYREDIISRGVQIPGPLQISVGTPEETYYLAVDDDSVSRLAALLREAQLLARNLTGAAK